MIWNYIITNSEFFPFRTILLFFFVQISPYIFYYASNKLELPQSKREMTLIFDRCLTYRQNIYIFYIFFFCYFIYIYYIYFLFLYIVHIVFYTFYTFFIFDSLYTNQKEISCVTSFSIIFFRNKEISFYIRKI